MACIQEEVPLVFPLDDGRWDAIPYSMYTTIT